jgi:endonuclease III
LRSHEEVRESVKLVKDRDVPVESAIQVVSSTRRAKEVAAQMTDTLREALIETAQEAKKIEESDVRKLMENYMFLGTIRENPLKLCKAVLDLFSQKEMLESYEPSLKPEIPKEESSDDS